MYTLDTLEHTAETSVLFSAFHLAKNSHTHGDLESVVWGNLCHKTSVGKHLYGVEKPKESVQDDNVLNQNCAATGEDFPDVIGDVSDNSNLYNLQHIIKILSCAIDEIIDGLENQRSECQKNYYKFEVATILVMLALQKDNDTTLQYQPNELTNSPMNTSHCTSHHTGSLPSDHYVKGDQFGLHFELLDVYPKISMDLAVFLIVKCHLEKAFIWVLQKLDLNTNLTILSKIILNLCTMFDESPKLNLNYPQDDINDRQRDKTCVKMFSDLLTELSGYVFLYKEGLGARFLEEANSEIWMPYVTFIENFLNFMCSLISRICTQNQMHTSTLSSNEQDNSLKDRDVITHKDFPFMIASLVGWLNLIHCLETRTFLLGFDFLQPNFKSVDIDERSVKINSESKSRINKAKTFSIFGLKKKILKYQLLHIDETDLLISVIDEFTNENIQKSELTVETSKLLENDETTKHLMKGILKTVKYLTSEGCNVFDCLNVGEYLLQESETDNFFRMCYYRATLQEIYGSLTSHGEEFDKFFDSNKGELCDQKLYKLKRDNISLLKKILEKIPNYENRVPCADLSVYAFANRNIFFICERLGNYKNLLQWLLLKTTEDVTIIDNSDWVHCMRQNIDLLDSSLHADALLAIILKLYEHKADGDDSIKSNLSNVIAIFLEIFSKLEITNQDDLMEILFTNIVNPKIFFSKQNINIPAVLTSLMNKMVFNCEELVQAKDIGCRQFVKEVALLGLQDPIHVLSEMLEDVIRNSKHCQIIVEVLRQLPSLCSYCEEALNIQQGFQLSTIQKRDRGLHRTSTPFIVKFISSKIAVIHQFSDKQCRSFLKLITIFVTTSYYDNDPNVTLIDKNVLLTDVIIPLLEHVPLLQKGAFTKDVNRYNFTLKIVQIILESVQPDNFANLFESSIGLKKGKQISHDHVSNICNATVLLSYLCLSLDKINCSLEHAFKELHSPSNDHRGETLSAEDMSLAIGAKNLLMKCMDCLLHMLKNNLLINSNEAQWLYTNLSLKTRHYCSVGYVMPLLWTFQNRYEKFSPVIRMHMPIPGDLVYNFNAVDCAKDFVFVRTKAENEHSTLHKLLLLCSLSEDICNLMVKKLTRHFGEFKSAELIIALGEILPIVSVNQWKTIHSLLMHHFHLKKLSVTGNESIENNKQQLERFFGYTNILRHQASMLMLESVVLLLNSKMITENPLFEKDLVINFAIVYSDIQITMMRSVNAFVNQFTQTSIKHSTEFVPEILCDVYLPNLSSLCWLITEIVCVDCYDHVTSILLESVDCCLKLQKCYDPDKFLKKFRSVVRTILDPLPKKLRGIAFKKLG